MLCAGHGLADFDRVRHEHFPGEWVVLPFDDGCRWLGRRDGSLIPLIPSETYVVVSRSGSH